MRDRQAEVRRNIDTVGAHRNSPSSRTVLRGSLVVILIALLGLTAAGPAGAADPGKTVALTPLSANTMALIGAYPAAIGQTLGGERRFVSGLRTTSKLTLSHPLGPNREELALYSPKLIYTSPEWAKGRSMMQSIAGKVVDADPKSVQGTYRTIDRISRTFGRKARGQRLVKRIKSEVRRARRGLANKRKVRVMMILGVNKTPFVFLGNTWGGQLVRLAGGRLLTGGASSSGGFVRIGDDVVVQARPDVIIGVPHSSSENIPDAISYLRTNPGWRSTPAVRNGRVYISTDNSLLQAGTDIGRTITTVRKKFLKNG